jgi:hypothetical protein
MSDAYLQLPLEECSRELVTVNTQKGLFRFRRLPFGVAAGRAIFQRCLESVLEGLNGVIIYLDDICVTGRSEQEHLQNLQAVLNRLRERGLVLSRSKCVFMTNTVDYLGFRVDKNGVHPTEEKVRAIRSAPVPRNVTELRAYLGLINYYSRFCPNLATCLSPLYTLLRKDVPWGWTKSEQDAYVKSKNLLLSDTVLTHYDPNIELMLACDASAYGIGGVLQHQYPDGKEKPIAFASRTLNSAERNYSQIEKEALAIVFATTKFKQYILGRKVTIITDHKPLLSLFGNQKGIPMMAAARIKRWALQLASFSYNLQFRSSAHNANADALSRLPLPDTESAVDDLQVLAVSRWEELPLSAATLALATKQDLFLRKVMHYVLSGWPEEPLSSKFKPFHSRSTELSMEQGILLWGSRVIVPEVLQHLLLEELHSEHFGVVRMKLTARQYLVA